MLTLPVKPIGEMEAFDTPGGAVAAARARMAPFEQALVTRPRIEAVSFSDATFAMQLSDGRVLVLSVAEQGHVDCQFGEQPVDEPNTLPDELRLAYGDDLFAHWDRRTLRAIAQGHQLLRVIPSAPFVFIYIRGLPTTLFSAAEVLETGQRILHWEDCV